jgi:trehalose 6-phosphate synthase/phosphatase
MEKWFGNLNIGLAAEHGAAFKEDGVWQELIAPIDWDDEIVSILKEFVDKTPGSHLETKKTALVWHFRCVDDWLAVIREQQLINVLMSPCNRHGLQLMRGNKILEIKSPVYSKAIELKRLLKNGKYDFMLAIGDDVTDEDMFMAMPNNAFSIKVGMMSDTAKYNIPLQADVLPILRTICNMNS